MYVVRDPYEIQSYAQIVHLYFIDQILDKKESQVWMNDFGLDLEKVDKYKIVFYYYDDFYPTKMTLYKSGRIIVENEGNEPI